MENPIIVFYDTNRKIINELIIDLFVKNLSLANYLINYSYIKNLEKKFFKNSF